MFPGPVTSHRRVAIAYFFDQFRKGGPAEFKRDLGSDFQVDS